MTPLRLFVVLVPLAAISAFVVNAVSEHWTLADAEASEKLFWEQPVDPGFTYADYAKAHAENAACIAQATGARGVIEISTPGGWRAMAQPPRDNQHRLVASESVFACWEKNGRATEMGELAWSNPREPRPVNMAGCASPDSFEACLRQYSQGFDVVQRETLRKSVPTTTTTPPRDSAAVCARSCR